MESSLSLIALKQLQEIALSRPQSLSGDELLSPFLDGYRMGLRHAIELAEAAQARLSLSPIELTGGVVGRG